MNHLVLGRRQVAEILVQSFLVVEADPAEDLVLGVLEGREGASVDELGLEGGYPGLGHRVGERRRLRSIPLVSSDLFG